ncbi:MAG: hypothetical protein ABR977_05260 [Candidatus Dormibacteria bacterium]
MSTPQEPGPRRDPLRIAVRIRGAAVMVAALAMTFTVAIVQQRAASPGTSRLSSSPAAPSPPLAAGHASTPAAAPYASLATPRSTPTPSALLTVPACTAGDLRASSLTWGGVGAGSLYLSATLSLTSSAPCSLPDTASATLLDEYGDPLSFAVGSSPPGVPVTLGPTSGPATVMVQIGDHAPLPVKSTVSVDLGPGDQLSLQVDPSPWASFDTPSPGATPGPASETTFLVDISLPGRGI